MGQPELKSSNDYLTVDGLDDVFAEVMTDHDNEGDTTRQSATSTRRMSLREAADYWRVSERTIQRRIRSGILGSFKDESGRVFVTPDKARQPERQGATTSDTRDDRERQTAKMPDVLERLTAKLEAANWRNGYLEAQAESCKEQIKLLPDLQTRAMEAAQLKEQLATTEAELKHLKASWWYRIWCLFKPPSV